MAVILLRRYLFSGEQKYKSLSPNVQGTLKTFTIKSFENESETSVRRQVLSMLTDICDIDLAQGRWPELLPTLEKFCKSNNNVARGDAYFVLGTIASSSTFPQPQRDVISHVLIAGIGDPVLDVRVKSFEAVISFCECIDEQKDNSELSIRIINLLNDLIKLQNVEKMVEMFEGLIDLVTISPRIIRSHFLDFVKLASSLAVNENLASHVRILTLEFLVILAEEDNGLYRSSAEFIRLSFMAALSLMLNISDDPAWINNEDSEEESEMFEEGQYAIDRLGNSFMSEKVMNIAMPIIVNFLESQDWKKRVVALISISQMAEYIDKEHIQKFVSIVSNYYSDQNPRVAYYAIHCMGQMSDDFSPYIQNNFHSIILPPLVKILSNSSSVKIQSHAGAAIVNFVENADESKDILHKYIPEMLKIFYDLLQRSHRLVKEQVVTIVSAMSSLVPKHMHNSLKNFLPILMDNFVNCLDKTCLMYKCKCLEALSFIGSELPRQEFISIAHKIMEITIKELPTMRQESEDYYDFVLQAWIRLSKILKTEFSRYLPQVMPLVLMTASEGDEENELTKKLDEDESDEDYNPETGQINEIESAMCALTVFPEELGAVYYPFLEQSINVCKENLDFWGDENVRIYAARAFSSLFRVVSQSTLQNQVSVENAILCMNEFLQTLMKAYMDEGDYSVKKAILTAICDIFSENEDLSLKFYGIDNGAKRIIEAMLSLVEISKVKCIKLAEKERRSAFDQEEHDRYEKIREFETDIVYKVTENIGVCLKLMKDRIIPIFSPFLKQILLCLSNDETMLIVRKAFLLIVDDTLLYIPKAVEEGVDYLMEIFIKSLKSDSFDIKQASIYGLGLIAEKFTAKFNPKSRMVMEICRNLITFLRGKQEESAVTLCDNAITCYGRVVMNCLSDPDLASNFRVWLSMLPVSLDPIEIKFTTSSLLKIIQTGDTKFLGENLMNLPGILNVIALNFKKTEAAEEERKAFGEFVLKLKTLPAESQSKLASSLTEDTMRLIKKRKKSIIKKKEEDLQIKIQLSVIVDYFLRF